MDLTAVSSIDSLKIVRTQEHVPNPEQQIEMIIPSPPQIKKIIEDSAKKDPSYCTMTAKAEKTVKSYETVHMIDKYC